VGVGRGGGRGPGHFFGGGIVGHIFVVEFAAAVAALDAAAVVAVVGFALDRGGLVKGGRDDSGLRE
jgi:hypothetical protein